MAWNEPENNDRDKNGWNNGPRNNGKDDGPPELDQLLSDLMGKLSRLFGGKGGGNRGGGFGQPPENKDSGLLNGLTIGILVIILVAYLGMGFYTVDEQERGVVLRFGRALDGVVPPGLHWNPPLIDQVEKINVTRIYDVDIDGTMLTIDDNIVDLNMHVQYIVTSARDYFLNVRDPEISLQHAAESAIRHVVGSTEMTTALTAGREQMAVEAQERLQNYLELYGTGITVSQVNIDRSQPPNEVRAAFDDVIKADEDNRSYQNQARAYANQVIPEARGRARRVVEEASAYRDQVIAQAEGEASRFEQLLVEYQRAPEVTRERLYLDTLQSVMTSSSKILVDVEGGNNMFYVPLDKILEGRNAPDLSNSSSSMNANDIRRLADEVIRDINSRNTGSNTATINRGGAR